MSDYRVVVKVQNGRIYEKIRAKGYANVATFCRENGLKHTEIGLLLNLKMTPINKKGEFRPSVLRMAEALGELPEDLFTERQYEAVPSNVRDFLVEEQYMAQLLAPDIERNFALVEMAGGIQSRANLTERENQVIDLRFKSDMTLAEVAGAMGVTQERVRQIEAKALRKMRHPNAIADIERADFEQ